MRSSFPSRQTKGGDGGVPSSRHRNRDDDTAIVGDKEVSIDNLNGLTFGSPSSVKPMTSMISSTSSPKTAHSYLAMDPAITTIVRRQPLGQNRANKDNESKFNNGERGTFTEQEFHRKIFLGEGGQELVSDDELDLLGNDEEELPPGMQPESPIIKRKVLTMGEIEARLGKVQVTPLQHKKSDINWLPLRSNRPPVITFPRRLPRLENRHPSELDAVDSLGRHCGLMSRYEQEGIARIHRSQLTTEYPALEDYYYRAFSKKIAARGRNDPSLMGTMPLYLPLPGISVSGTSPKRIQHQSLARKEARTVAAAKMKEVFATALGKKSVASHKAPRPQLAMPAVPVKSLHDEEDSMVAGKWSATWSVELIYDAVIAIEQNLEEEDEAFSSESKKDNAKLYELAKTAIEVIDKEFCLGSTIVEVGITPEQAEARFLTLLAVPKTMVILGRALRAIDSTMLAERFMKRLVELFEYLSVCRVDVSEHHIGLFVNCVLAPLVPWAARAPASKILELLEILVGKRSLLWIVCTRPGLVLFCILLSRMEILKSQTSSDEDQINEEYEKLNLLVESLFDSLQERLTEIFSRLNGVDTEFYGWQFMALLALNVDADRKRILVMELRDKILEVASHPEHGKAINNLNIFLNTLGLDASQLAIS